jgi:hypothetical protein
VYLFVCLFFLLFALNSRAVINAPHKFCQPQVGVMILASLIFSLSSL